MVRMLTTLSTMHCPPATFAPSRNTMSKKVVLVGHCGPDSSYLRMTVQKALSDVAIMMADDDQDLQKFIRAGVDLLLVNRTLDYGFACEGGAELIKHLRMDHPELRAMLVSN